MGRPPNRAPIRDSGAANDSAVKTSALFAKYSAQGNWWVIFKTFLDAVAVADAAAAPVAAKYTGVLAAADVFTPDNAWALPGSLRIDAGLLGWFGVHP